MGGKDPARRAPIVVDWLPIATRAEDGSLCWHPALQDFIAEFGNQPGVLSALSVRFLPHFSWGSLVPQLEPLVKLLNSWSAHSRAEVRHGQRTENPRVGSSILSLAIPTPFGIQPVRSSAVSVEFYF